MTVSLIITTYNWKEALELVLLSVLNQTKLPDEVIIADDGSKNDTKEFINKFKKRFTIPLIHSWQEDKGFRAAKSRNLAISKAKSEYIILIDGDMILHKNFVENHLASSEKNTFIQGSRVLLSVQKAKEVLKTKQIIFDFFEKGILNRENSFYSKVLSLLLQKKNQKLKGIKTCNISFFRKDCFDINGFNEDFIGWGREDSEFVVRLFNNGILRKNVKFNAIQYHIYHLENSKKMLAVNDKILNESIDNKLKYCKNGIDKYIEEKNES